MTDILQTLFTVAAWAIAAASVFGMTVVPLSLFVEDRIKRRRKPFSG